VRRIVFVTQRVDPDHPVLAAAVPKIVALAERVDEVTVLALSAKPGVLPPNCRVRTFGAPTQALRGVRYSALVAQEVALRRPAAILAHMSPIYALLAAPFARLRGVRVLLWFTQQRAGANLARAARVVDAILSVDARSVPLDSPKVVAIGHGIDTDAFGCDGARPSDRLTMLSLGRYSDVKRHDVALQALRLLVDDGVDAELVVCGDEATPNDRDVRASLDELVGTLGLGERASVRDAVPRGEVRALFARTDVLVNATRGFSADKVVLEAAASCLPVVAASPVFDTLLPDELRFSGGVEELATRLGALARMPAAERLELGAELRRRVVEHHSVGRWADAVLEAAGTLRRG